MGPRRSHEVQIREGAALYCHCLLRIGDRVSRTRQLIPLALVGSLIISACAPAPDPAQDEVRGTRSGRYAKFDHIAPTRSCGSLIFVRRRGSQTAVFKVVRASGKPVRVTEFAHQGVSEADVSSDGGLVAYTSGLHQEELHVISSDGQHHQTVAQDSDASFSYPRWRPGGNELAVVRAPSAGPPRLLVISPDGSVVDLGKGTAPDWGPDGRRLAFGVPNRGGLGRIDVAELDPRPLIEGRTTGPLDGFPEWDPSGSRIAFLRGSKGSGYLETFVAPSDDLGRARQITNDRNPLTGSADLSWHPSGDEITYTTVSDIEGRVETMEVGGKEGVQPRPRQVGDLNSSSGTWSASGDLAYVQGRRIHVITAGRKLVLPEAGSPSRKESEQEPRGSRALPVSDESPVWAAC